MIRSILVVLLVSTLVIGVTTMASKNAKAQAGNLENTIYLDLKDGRVVIELRSDLAPKTAARIKELARQRSSPAAKG